MSDCVTVTVVKWHTVGGIVQPVGATYDVAADQVENLVAQGLVTAASPKTAPPKKTPATPATSTSVAPLGTHDLKTTEVSTGKRKTSLGAKRKK